MDAAFKAIEKVVGSGGTLLLYSVNAITSGTDAQGEVTVRLQAEGRVVNGQGADIDIVAASAKAYVNALNKLRSAARATTCSSPATRSVNRATGISPVSEQTRNPPS